MKIHDGKLFLSENVFFPQCQAFLFLLLYFEKLKSKMQEKITTIILNNLEG